MKIIALATAIVGMASSFTALGNCTTTASSTVCTNAPGQTTTQNRAAGHKSVISTSGSNDVLLDRQVISYDNTTVTVGRDAQGQQQIVARGSTLLNPAPTIPAPQFKPINYSTPQSDKVVGIDESD